MAQGSSYDHRENKDFNKRINLKPDSQNLTPMPTYSTHYATKSDVRKSDCMDRENSESQKSTRRFRGQNRPLPTEGSEDNVSEYVYEPLGYEDRSAMQSSSNPPTINLNGCDDTNEYQESSFHEVANATGNSMSTIKEESQENVSQSSIRPSNIGSFKSSYRINVSHISYFTQFRDPNRILEGKPRKCRI